MVTDAEIYWILDVVQNHYSLIPVAMSIPYSVFRYSKIVELFRCGNTKCSYIINFAIGPYFQFLLDQALKEAPYFVCSFDESYNSAIKKGQANLIA